MFTFAHPKADTIKKILVLTGIILLAYLLAK